MAIDLANYEQKAREAVKIFWESREQARQKQTTLARWTKASVPALLPEKTWTDFWPW